MTYRKKGTQITWKEIKEVPWAMDFWEKINGSHENGHPNLQNTLSFLAQPNQHIRYWIWLCVGQFFGSNGSQGKEVYPLSPWAKKGLGRRQGRADMSPRFNPVGKEDRNRSPNFFMWCSCGNGYFTIFLAVSRLSQVGFFCHVFQVNLHCCKVNCQLFRPKCQYFRPDQSPSSWVNSWFSESVV
jgi:hypothetical protein